jgi:ubiquinone/menaquinone biosynthesis C-methylase UbiE/uncharacterized protein YbaR (Trm112 family)
MHKKFLDYLADPETGSPLELVVVEARGEQVVSGFLRSPTAEYPIVRGVPRFAGFDQKCYTESFGYQWRRWPRLQFESENVGGPMEGHTKEMWEKITGARGELAGKVALDIGCGSGRFVDVARSKGARVIGIDYSAAVEAAAENFREDPEVCICQADALKLPLKAAAVDEAFSIGVLHHTPDPVKGVMEAARVIKPGGSLSLAVYYKYGYYNSYIVKIWRRFFSALQPKFGQTPALIYAYLVVYGFRPVAHFSLIRKGLKAVFPFMWLPDIRWSVLDTFDCVTPSYQSGHEPPEVAHWFKECGFSNIEPTGWGLTSFRGQIPQDSR